MSRDFILSTLSIRFQRRLKPSQILKFPIFIFHRDDSQKAMAGCMTNARKLKQANTKEGLATESRGLNSETRRWSPGK